jgi:hypothetical protein
MTKMKLHVFLLVLIFSWSSVRAVTPGQFHAFADSMTYVAFKYDPVFATRSGVHLYDDKMPDASIETLAAMDTFFHNELRFLENTDTSGWPTDDQIDYILELSNINIMILYSEQLKTRQKSAAYYAEQCFEAIYFLTVRNDIGINELYPALYGRLLAIPRYLDQAKSILIPPSRPDIIAAANILDALSEVIMGSARKLTEQFPERTGAISTARDKALLAMKDFTSFLLVNDSGKLGDIGIGEQNYKDLFYNMYQINIEPDSLLDLAQSEYRKADSLVQSQKTRLPIPKSNPYDIGMHDLIDKPAMDSILAYCNGEVKHVENYLDSANILTVPQGITNVVFTDLPMYLNHAGFYHDFLINQSPLDSGRASYFYSLFTMLNVEAGSHLPSGYFDERFREDVIKYIVPGEHYITQLSQKHSSLDRKLADNDMMEHGWEFYINGLLIEQGLLGNDPQVLYDYYSDLRSYALGTIVEIGLHTKRMTVDSAAALVKNSLGSDSASYKTSGIETVENPFANISYMLGRLLILDMREKAKAKEGDKFSLKDFHDKILSEGCIPPALIAKKYGWQ